MKEIIKRGATSNILRVFLQDSTSTTGAGKTTLTSASSGLIISTIADNEATATTYTSAATNVETITTLGTFAAPTASKCRFREVDATNFPGVYEIHIADARFAVANSTKLLISIQCTGVAPVFVEYQLVAVDLMDTVRLGLTAIPNIAQGTTGAISTGNATGQVTVVATATNALTSTSFAAGAIDAAAIAANAITSSELDATALAVIADAILKRNLDSSGNEASTTSNGRTVRNALRILRNKVDASGGTQVDVYNEADTTVIWSQPITTSVTADPIVKVG